MPENNGQFYASMILEQAPRVLSLMDRDPLSPTAGCGDRTYWAWKFVDYPGARFQEALCVMSFLYATELPDSPYFHNRRLLQWIELGLRFWCSIQYPDGSFDEAYPLERSLAATAFTAFYIGEAMQFLGDACSEETRVQVRDAMRKAGEWLIRNDETHGFLEPPGRCRSGTVSRLPGFARRALPRAQPVFHRENFVPPVRRRLV